MRVRASGSVWIASKNPSASGFVNTSFHVRQPSVVLYTRLRSPLPLLITSAVCPSKACTPRKSSFSAPGGTAHPCHTNPLSSVRSTVPFVPLAQATPLPGLAMPRRLAVVVESCKVNCALAGDGAQSAIASHKAGIPRCTVQRPASRPVTQRKRLMPSSVTPRQREPSQGETQARVQFDAYRNIEVCPRRAHPDEDTTQATRKPAVRRAAHALLRGECTRYLCCLQGFRAIYQCFLQRRRKLHQGWCSLSPCRNFRPVLHSCTRSPHATMRLVRK